MTLCCHSERASLEVKHIEQLKKLYLEILKYSENHDHKTPRLLNDLVSYENSNFIHELIYCVDKNGHRIPWIYYRENFLTKKETKILVKSPLKYSNDKYMYLDIDGHVYLK
jgi:hypothetical protein